MNNDFVPVFYSRGFNAPFIEGHLQILRMMLKSLSFQNVRSVVFNYRYGSIEQQSEQGVGESYCKFEQKIPFLGREEVISASEKTVVAWTSLFETIASMRFMFAETSMTEHRRIVNIINCFRYPRLLARGVIRAPVLLHFYKKDAFSHMKNVTGISDLFIVTSRSIATYLKCEHDVSRDKIKLVYPPIDTNLFKPLGKEYARNVLKLPKEDKIVLYLGNLNDLRFPENVALDLIEDLASKYSRVVLQIYTSENTENVEKSLKLTRHAKSLGLSEHVNIQTRNLSDVEKSLIFNAADVFFFPSNEAGSFVEPPLSVLEAMSSGLPVVSRDISSLNELLSGKSRDFLVSSEADNSSYCDKVDQVLSKSDTAVRSGIDSRKVIIRNASLDIVGAELCGIYRSLLD